MIFSAISKLVTYGIETGLVPVSEKIYTTNMILDVLGMQEYVEPEEKYHNVDLESTLAELLQYAVEHKIIDDSIVYRDGLDSKLMNCLMPRPETVICEFNKMYEEDPEKATEYFYKLSQDSDYIRRYRVCKDMKWVTPTEYGDIDITINLSKPEKDPKAIAAAKLAKQSGYPKCLLCKENEGYAGTINHPARYNHRIMPVEINHTQWGFQYSPYVYYNEHCIVFHGEHVPMKVDKNTFVKLFDFVKKFPHYFLGSNADLPIVGGSILAHDHFQGGNYEFAMAKAPMEKKFVIKGYSDIEAGIVKWPLSVIRLRGEDTDRIIELADHILKSWRVYTDESVFLYAETQGEPHNTITPIARKKDGKYELDLALRNNITTSECPMGVFHPHEELHHIKKENIGLIEVMGLAVLPSRLKREMEVLEEYILSGKDIRSNPLIEKHADWTFEFLEKYDKVSSENINAIIKDEIGKVFAKVLEYAGVFKRDTEGMLAFERFIDSL